MSYSGHQLINNNIYEYNQSVTGYGAQTNLNHELVFKYTLSILITMVTALIEGEYINYYNTYNGEIFGQCSQSIIIFTWTHYFFPFSEFGISSFQAYLTDRKESKGNRQLTYFFLGLLIINFVFMVFLKMYALCIIKRKLSIGKAKIKNLVSFNNLFI